MVTIEEAVGIYFKATGKKEASITDISEYIKSNVSDYTEDELEKVKGKVSRFLSRNVKSKNKKYIRAINPKTKKARQGVYAIAPVKKAKPLIIADGLFKNEGVSKPNPTTQKTDTPLPNVGTTYFGKGGEFAVASELLFRGYNASVMSVDEGIDIIASKNDRFFYIQVKSTTFSNDVIKVTLKPNNFVSTSDASIFYIIVFRYMCKLAKAIVNRYIVLPKNDIDRLETLGLISSTQTGLQIKIKQMEDKFVLYNGVKTDSSIGEYFLDNFDLIK